MARRFWLSLFSLSLILCLIGCVENKDKDPTGFKPDVGLEASVFAKNKFITSANGVWVATDYIDEIRKTKSPLRSGAKLQGIVTLIIDTSDATDSIDVGASLNNHEGYNFTAYLIPGLHGENLKTNIVDYNNKYAYYELGLGKADSENSLVLYHYDKTDKLIDKKQFTKVANNQADVDAGWGIQYVVNKELMAGNYLMTDSLGHVAKVAFGLDGSVNGAGRLRTYYLETDVWGAPAVGFDHIAFNLDKQDTAWFGLKVLNDTIYLYTVRGNQEAGERLRLDRLQYKLSRQ